MTHTHYDNLRITPNATAGLIKAAYRALCQEFHPDKNPSADATRIMQIINDAYSVLSDPVTRAKYDAKLAAEEVAASKSAQAKKQHEQRRWQDETERKRRDSEAVRRQREAQAAERQRQANDADRKRRADAAAEQARRDKPELKRLGDYLVLVFIIGIVLLGILLAISKRPDMHMKPDAGTLVESNVDTRAKPDVLDRPELVRWVKSVRDGQHRREVYYAGDLVNRDGDTLDVWLMRKYDVPVTGEGKSEFTYGIEPARIDCAMHTIANGAGAVYDQTWNKVANFVASAATPLLNHPLDVQSTAAFLCAHAYKQNG